MADGTYIPTAGEVRLIDGLLTSELFMGTAPNAAPMSVPFAHEQMWDQLVGDVRKESAP